MGLSGQRVCVCENATETVAVKTLKGKIVVVQL